MITNKFLLILPILILFSSCEKEKGFCQSKPCLAYQFWSIFIKPSEDKANSCKVPNSVKSCGSQKDCSCTNQKYTSGLIYDISISDYIQVEKISTSKTLRCLCPNKIIPRIIKWSKGVELNLETFPPNVPIDYISAGANENTDFDTTPLPIGTNLFCIVQCQINEEDRYQILKIRSN